MNLFPNPQYKNSFLSGNTAKPIAGVVARSAWTRPLKQVQVSETLTQGSAVTLTNKIGKIGTDPVNAGGLDEGLSPNVLKATKATDITTTQGFIVESPNFVLEDGDEAPAARAGQIVYCALIGSGTELYLPCDNSLVDCAPNQAVKLEDGVLKKADADGLNLLLMSQVVDGVVFYEETGAIKQKESPVIKVKL